MKKTLFVIIGIILLFCFVNRLDSSSSHKMLIVVLNDKTCVYVSDWSNIHVTTGSNIDVAQTRIGNHIIGRSWMISDYHPKGDTVLVDSVDNGCERRQIFRKGKILLITKDDNAFTNM